MMEEVIWFIQYMIYTLEEKMEKNNGVRCSFCIGPSGEIRTILRIIYRQLDGMLLEKKYQDMGNNSQENNGAIARLVRIAFDQHQFELKISKSCPHLKLRNMLREKLKCRSDQLEIMLEDLCDRIARRNYQLEIIASQVKNVENSINENDQISYTPASKRQTSEEAIFREEENDQVKEEKQVKVEQLVSPANNIVEGSPETVIPYVSTTFGEMPYSYNFLFYGPYYH